VASKADAWRRRIRRGLASTPAERDPRALLLDHVVGRASPELIARLEGPSREAAVLLGLIERRAGLSVLLTERAAHLAHHPGQISLPGGQLDAGEDPVTAALREAFEEVALAPGDVDVLGRMPAQLTATGFTVTPVVGWVGAEDFVPRPDPAEVQSAFEVPLVHLLEPANRRRARRVRWGTEFMTEEFLFEQHRIWGATAAILARFIEVINE
jgi:8-oxo-dGTP pyrophosphatase MutT (NUDIX family)